MWSKALRLDGLVRDPNALHVMLVEYVCRHAKDFALVHFHLDYYPFSAISRQVTPFLATLHGRLSPPEHQPVFSVFSPVLLVSISNSQRRPISNANWIGTVHGLPINLLTLRPVCPSYLALALLVPIDWPEPFGLVMIEAMAFGTPVIAFNRGSVPDVIEDGLTGYLVETRRARSAPFADCSACHVAESECDSKSDLRLDHGRVVFGDIHAID